MGRGAVIVLDASVVLAAILGEPGGQALQEGGEYAISAVNLAEVASKLSERGLPAGDVALITQAFRDFCIPLTEAVALQAGILRPATRPLGLSLGDRCCLALAQALRAEVWTMERKWAALDLDLTIRVLR